MLGLKKTLSRTSILSSKCPDTERPLFQIRFIMVFLMFLADTLGYAMRVNMSISIIAMTNSNGAVNNVRTFDWDPQIQSIILSSFFWG